MDVLEIETAEGWVPVLAKIRPLGAGKFRAELRLPTCSPMATAKLRYAGQPVRHSIVETKASSRPAVAVAVLLLEMEGEG